MTSLLRINQKLSLINHTIANIITKTIKAYTKRKQGSNREELKTMKIIKKICFPMSLFLPPFHTSTIPFCSTYPAFSTCKQIGFHQCINSIFIKLCIFLCSINYNLFYQNLKSDTKLDLTIDFFAFC